MKRNIRAIVDHLWGPLVGVVVNALVVVALLAYVSTAPRVDSEIVQVKRIEAAEREEIEQIEEELREVEEEIMETTDEELVFNTDETFDTEFEEQNNDEVVETVAEVDTAEMSALMSDIASPVVMDNILGGRNKAGRASSLARYGGGMGGKTEPAVLKALRWLKDHQLPDGGWSVSGNSGGGNPGPSGLALLAFLAHGDTPASVEFGETVTAGIKYLLKIQDASGMIKTGGHGAYAHAMATYALSEAYTMTQLAPLKPAMEKAVDVIMKGQQKSGGYDYGYKLTERNDSSVSGWQVQALKAAYIAGAENDGLKQKLDMAIEGMLANSKKVDGGGLSIGYTSPAARPAISAACLLGLQLTGQHKRKEAKGLLNYVEGMNPSLKEGLAQNHGGPYYQWYYIAQAKFQADADKGGRIFRKFNPLMVKYMLATQEPEGSWTPEAHAKAGEEHGKDDPVKKDANRRVQSTAMAALTLMVYYRHLPTSQHVSSNLKDAAKVLEDEEDAVEIIF